LASVAEVRIDPGTGDWRIVAPERAARPVDRAKTDEGVRACPFCPGHEHLTPPEVLRVPAGDPAWRVRVVPNKFAFVAPRTDGRGGLDRATGEHEVVIESSRHDWDIRQAGPDEMAEILFAVRDRCRAMAGHDPAAVIPFRNYGAAAGNSLVHPHSQLVALDHAPPGLVNRWRRAREHHAGTGRQLLDEVAAGSPEVARTDEIVIFQPHAASVPHETTVAPVAGAHEPAADLATASDPAVVAVAAALPPLLTAIAEVLADPAYNLVVHAGPPNDPDAIRWYRWHVTIYPRVTTPGGLEFATGLAVNPTAPENTAPLLRAARDRHNFPEVAARTVH
jgi:UDPglucose--hexose-1-phosphate uridylyltransferase